MKGVKEKKRSMTDKTAKNLKSLRREMLQAIGDNLIDGIIVFTDVDVIYANEAFFKMLGAQDIHEIKNADLYQLLDPEDAKFLANRISDLFKGKSAAIRYEAKVKRFDGGEVPLSFSLSRVECGNEVCILGIVRDITRERKTKEELHESKEKYRAIVEKTHDGIFIYQNDRLVFFNDRVCDYTGYSKEELKEINFWSLLHPEDKPRMMEIVRKRTRGEPASSTCEVRLISKNGEVKYCEFSLALVNYHGKYAILGALRDVTERKRHEEMLKRADRILQAVNYSAEQFLKSPSWEEGINDILARLGKAADVSRVYIFKNMTKNGDILTSQLYEWVAPGVTPQIDNPDLQDTSCQRSGFRRWAEVLSRGELIYGDIADFPESERVVLEAQDIKSIVVVPIFVENKWWGFIGFDECRRKRKWSLAEMEALKAAANILGAAIERKNVEERLARLLNAVKMSTDAVIVTDLEKRVIDLNDTATRMLGYDNREECIGQHLKGIFTPDVWKKMEKDFNEAFEKGSFKRHVYPVISRKKEKADLEFSGTLMKDIRGKPHGFVIIGRDVTDKKKAEEKLKESESRYKFLFEQSQTVNLVLGMDGRIIDVNDAALKFFGYTRKEVIGRPAMDFVVPEHKEIASKSLLKDFRGEEAPQLEIDILTKKGRRTLLFASGHAPVYEKGQKVGILLSAIDVTEMKKANKLQEVLYRISSAAHSVENLAEFFDIIRNELSAIIDTKNFFIALYDRKTDTFSLPYFRDEKDHFKTFPAGKTLTAYLIRKNKPILVRRNDIDRMVKEGIIETIGTPSQVWLGVPLRVGNKVIGAVVVQSYTNPNQYTEKDMKVLQFVADQIAVVIERKKAEQKLAESYRRLKQVFESTIQAIAGLVEKRDPYTAGHQRRVADLACAIAREMGLPEDKIEGIRMAGIIHDIGKIAVPAEILSKPGKLTEIEFSIIKTHPEVSYNILKGIEFPWPIAEAVYQHHERLDGSGYPRGLKGDEIILEARILAVADVVEAMVSHRPYRPALSLEEALQEIIKNKGKLYDPDVVDACVRLFTEKKFEFNHKT